MIPETALSYVGYGLFGVGVFTAFLMTPLSNVLNIITLPLGYEFSSCPHCTDFGIKKIETHVCDYCGDEHGRGFGGASAYIDGEKYLFCSNECLDSWERPE